MFIVDFEQSFKIVTDLRIRYKNMIEQMRLVVDTVGSLEM